MRKNPIILIFILLALTAMTACSVGVRQEFTPPPEAESPTTIAENTATSPAEPGSGDQAGQTFEIDPTAVDGAPGTEPGTAAEGTQPDILGAFPPAAQIDGQILLVYGRVLDANGNTIPGARVEFWQTDSEGIYDHPGDADTQARNPNFQFYGSSIVDDNGVYRFRTIVPGEYAPRPAHIHVKVWLSGAELLTTQFYFAEDAENVQNESIFRSAGEAGENLFLIAERLTDAHGSEVLVARKDIVIDTGSGGDLATTPAQAEGPYYPLANVSEYDNDLIIVE